MKYAPVPQNEKMRLLSLQALNILDTQPEERFDRITRTAIKIFHMPISTLTLVDAKREWFKSCQGLPDHEGKRAISFCGHALFTNEILVITDTKKDIRFSDNPLVIGKPYIRFYAGVPLMSADGQRIGVLCIKDTKPREFSKNDEDILKGLAAWAEIELNSHNLSLIIIEMKKLQKRLIQYNKKFQEEKVKNEAILRSIGDGVIVIDTNRKILLINQQAQRMLHCKAGKVVGRKYSDIWSEFDEQGKEIPLDQRPMEQTMLAKTTIRSNNIRYIHKGTFDFPAAINSAPVMLDGKLLGVVVVFRDISKEKEIDRIKSEFISLASHQLRTPLTAIKWFGEMLLSGDAGKLLKEQEEFVKNIFQSNERMIALVNSLLNISRMESGRLMVVPHPTDLSSLVKEVIDELAVKIKEKNQEVSVNISSDLPKINLDPKLVRNIYLNLLINSVKYTPEKGTISVNISIKGDQVISQVSDNGIGIAQKEQHRVFDKFFRGDNIIKIEPDGTGLGLYLVKSIVESSQGKIWFESKEGKGLPAGRQGTTFWFPLPLKGMPLKKGEVSFET